VDDGEVVVVSGSDEEPRRGNVSEAADKILDEAMTFEPHARTAYVEQSSQHDPELRKELISRLHSAEVADVFFDRLSELVFSTAFSSDENPTPTDESQEFVLGEEDVIAHYRIVSLIGRGGMGTLYRARDERLNRDVALKFLPSSLSTERKARERLLTEARAVAALNHPNVCAIYEIAETADGHMFFAMPLYDGMTLKEKLRQGPLSIEESVSIAIQIARGLAAAHARGIVHRDVKPGNIMLSPDGTVRLLDFGLAIPIDGSLTSSGSTRGTVAYMSPQQARGEPIDARSDLWSLGVVLYEMIAGRRPFHRGNPAPILDQIFHWDAEPLSMHRQEISGALARIVERLLQRDPVKRFESAGQLLDNLQGALPTDEGSSRASRFLRDRVLVLGGGALVVVLIGFLSWRRQAETKLHPPDHSSTRNIAAYEHYLRSMDQPLVRTDSGARIALEHVQQAIALDTGYAAAYARLARLHVRIANGNDPEMSRRDRLALAEQAALTAVALDDSSGESHAALGKVMKYLNRRPLAVAELRRAIALDPSNAESLGALAELLVEVGYPEEALVQARRAREQDPLSPIAISEVAHALLASDRCDEALAELAKLRSVRPPLNRAIDIAAQCYARKKMWPQAIAEVERIIPTGGMRAQAMMGYYLGRAGRKAEARSILDDLIRRSHKINGNAYYVAMVYAGLGDRDQAMEWLERSVDDLSFIADWMPDIIRDFSQDARFSPIAHRLGIGVGRR
jgi:serine/threonine protein kinase/tetratricopeptide (TPR) repeat protein